MPTLQFPELVAQLTLIFERAGCSPSVASQLAANCAAAERDGSKNTGIYRVPGYVSSLRGKWVDGRAEPKVEDVAPGFVRVDAANGYAVPALGAVCSLAIQKAKRNGCVVIAIRNSHHLGALSLDVEPFAEQGLVALSMVNSGKSTLPFEGKRPVFGTNPIAFAAPRQSGAPFVFDIATSAWAYGEVTIAAEAGKTIPLGVGVNEHGSPTTNPREIMDGGALNTFGGHKGAAISMMVEILCAALVGGQFSAECEADDKPGLATACTGQTVILISPDVGNERFTSFASRVNELIEFVKQAGQSRMPGDRKLNTRESSVRDGIYLSDEEFAMLKSYSEGGTM